MYTLILIMGMNVNTIGAYNSLADCQANLSQFAKMDVKAACVKQQSAEDAMKQANVVFSAFNKMVAQIQTETK